MSYGRSSADPPTRADAPDRDGFDPGGEAGPDNGLPSVPVRRNPGTGAIIADPPIEPARANALRPPLVGRPEDRRDQPVEPARAEAPEQGPFEPAGVPAPPEPPPGHERLRAACEVALCSGFPTQLTLVALFALLGAGPTGGSDDLSLAYVVTLSLVDAAVILALVWLLLRAGGEPPFDALAGRRPIRREALLGLALVPAAFFIVAGAFAFLQRFAPALRNVPENPLEALVATPAGALTFGAVAVVAGGLREEVQRAFILRRFDQHLGGAAVGLVVFSTAFGLGHLVQGRDAAVITGLLGAFWGVLFLVRGSMVGPFVCHAAFNAVQVLIAWAGRGASP